MNGILANTKPCPDCKRPIEKNMAGGVLRRGGTENTHSADVESTDQVCASA